MTITPDKAEADQLSGCIVAALGWRHNVGQTQHARVTQVRAVPIKPHSGISQQV
ncbi:hypothetical protein N9444_04100 [Gammaproteobacteria bacterium]|nr:hypothetical protein [Gammaproteobacteria bacterium]